MSENWNDITKVQNAIPAIIIWEVFSHITLVMIVLLSLIGYCSFRTCSAAKNFVHGIIRNSFVQDMKDVIVTRRQEQSIEMSLSHKEERTSFLEDGNISK